MRADKEVQYCELELTQGAVPLSFNQPWESPCQIKEMSKQPGDTLKGTSLN